MAARPDAFLTHMEGVARFPVTICSLIRPGVPMATAPPYLIGSPFIVLIQQRDGVPPCTPQRDVPLPDMRQRWQRAAHAIHQPFLLTAIGAQERARGRADGVGRTAEHLLLDRPDQACGRRHPDADVAVL